MSDEVKEDGGMEPFTGLNHEPEHDPECNLNHMQTVPERQVCTCGWWLAELGHRLQTGEQ